MIRAQKRWSGLLNRLIPFHRKEAAPARERLMNAFREKYLNFKALLESNSELLRIISDLETRLQGQAAFGTSFVESQTARVLFHAGRMVQSLERLASRPYPALTHALERIQASLGQAQASKNTLKVKAFTLPYGRITCDSADLVGEKNANLGEIMNRVGLPVPRGFAITAAAFERFIEANGLEGEIARLKANLDLITPDTVVRVSDEIQHLLISSRVPEDIEHTIMEAYKDLSETVDASGLGRNVSMRSSAIGEDSALSFAGQYLTVLNVPPKRMMDEYKRILASLFAPRAISYRLHMGIPFQEASMCVACQEMIRARASGVMYTRDPTGSLRDVIIVNAVWGLGPYAVEGTIPPDTYLVSKENPPRALDMKISPKTRRLSAHPDGYTRDETVKREIQDRSCLSEAQLQTLATYGMQLEEHFHHPQDVEWALDEAGLLVILQSRPIRSEMPHEMEGVARTERARGYPLLFEGGNIACPGTGFGPAYHVRSEADLLGFPDGGILIAANSAPHYVMVMQKASAILTDAGNITGHMAVLAREYMVPTIVNTGMVTDLIQPGTEITVDAYAGRVYLGKVSELLDAKKAGTWVIRSSPIYKALRSRADLIIPLNLVDPRSPAFAAQNCRTIHDIMRFVHEAAYAEVFQLGDVLTDSGTISVRLRGPFPLDLYVIDLGGGLTENLSASTVTADQIVSGPLKALLRGMLREDLRPRGPRPIELKGLFSVISEQLISPPRIGIDRFGDRSYAICSDKYLNFSSRVGYHFSILDSYSGPANTENYINFEFKGGAADDIRRQRRARLIKKILSSIGFKVEAVGDRVTARFDKRPSTEIEERLDYVGRLLLFSRQMDMLMHSEDCIEEMADCFLKGDYQLQSATICP
jgi:pyruvate,water dikinase